MNRAQRPADLEPVELELENWPAAGRSKIWNLGFCKPGLHKNGQLYVSQATRDAGGGMINWQLDTKKAAQRPL